MARKEEAEALIRRGFTPCEAAREMLVSVATVIQYVRTRVGEGALRFSEIYYFLPEEKRKVIETLIKRQNNQANADTPIEINFNLTLDDISFYKSLRTRSTFAGDLYEYVSEAEIAIHDLVSKTLKQQE
jgi:predicted transcriptional regulator